jgi:hypothetical protein
MTSTATAMMERVKIVITYSIPDIIVEPNNWIIPAKGGTIKLSSLAVTYSQIKTTSYPGTDKPSVYETITTGGDLIYGLYGTNGSPVD